MFSRTAASPAPPLPIRVCSTLISRCRAIADLVPTPRTWSLARLFFLAWSISGRAQLVLAEGFLDSVPFRTVQIEENLIVSRVGGSLSLSLSLSLIACLGSLLSWRHMLDAGLPPC